MSRTFKVAVASAKGAAIVTVVDLGIAATSAFFAIAAFVSALGLVMLLESAPLMLLGGAMSFAGQPGVRRMVHLLTRAKTDYSREQMEDLDAKAAVVALAGVLLFVESLVISFS